MQTTLAKLADLVDGRVVGDGQVAISDASPLISVHAGQITFIDHADRVSLLRDSPAAAALVPDGVSTDLLPVIQVASPQEAFARLVCYFRPPRGRRTVGVSSSSYVAESAQIAEGVDIHPGVYVGEGVQIASDAILHSGVRLLDDVQIGEGAVLYPNAVLYEGTIVGPRCIIHAGAVLGAYGFGYSALEGRHLLSSQLGYVVLEADVEIGANTTIDRGTYGPTTIGEGTKIDNLVMVGHNCQIGRHNLLCAQAGIAGSCRTGDYVVMAGQVGVRDHVEIGDRAALGAKAGVMNSIPAGQRYVGIPATPEREQMVKQAAWSKLPEMRRELRRLRAVVERLTDELENTNPSECDNNAT